MAPSRRRGSSKAASAVAAAAAAAAKRNWKVGDLVLAKVKGFPAWPATVSEPEKWGYSTDWKKVLVYFFGTKQIAFCNPADVEVFTEEKKKSLLSKRHGKGADFVRAVHEIVDCFDKSKKPEHNDELASDNEGTVPIATNLEDPMGRMGNETHPNSPMVVANSRLESSSLSSGNKESSHVIDVRAEVENNSFGDRDIGEQLENASSLAPIRETALTESNCSRKRPIDAPLQSFVRQKRVTVRRSRNSVNVEQYKLQHVMQVNDNKTNTGYALPNGNRNESAKRSRRIRKSPGSSIWHHMESPCYSAALISNVSSEENGSEICATNSDTISLNGGDTLESCCKNEQTGITVEVMDQGIKLNDKFSLPVETFVFKKKRKPNRKRLSHSIAALINSPKKSPGLDIKMEKSTSLSPSSCENMPDQLINSPKKSPGLDIKGEKSLSPSSSENLPDHLINSPKKSRGLDIQLINSPKKSPGLDIQLINSPKKSPGLDIKGENSASLSPSSYENLPDQLINSPKKSPGLDIKGEKSASLSPSACENVPDQLINSPNKSPGFDIKGEKLASLSPSSCGNFPDQLLKANGDEHLPLVKRARARMGKALSEEKQLNEVVKNAENMSLKEAPFNNSEASLSCPDGLHDLNGFSAAHDYNHTEKEPIWNACKYQLRGSVDCEAALPPSKRLHRALEAMSANAVEEGQTFVDAQGATKLTPSNDCSDSPDRSSSHISVDEVGSGSEFQKASSLADNDTDVNTCEPELRPCSASPTSKVLETTVSTPKGCDHPMGYSPPKSCDHPMDYSNTPKSDGVVEMEVVAKTSPEVKCVDDLPLNIHFDETKAGITSPHLSSRLESVNVSASQLKCDKHEVMGSSHESFNGTMKLEDSCFLEDQSAQGQGTLHPNKQPSNCVRDSSEVNGACISSPGDDGEHMSVMTVDSCKKLQSLMSPLETNVSAICEVVKDHARAADDVDMNSMKVLIAAAQAKRQLSLSTSISDNIPEDKPVCDFVTSPSSVRRMGSYEQVSPPSSVICHLASADDRNHLLPNGSLDVHCKKSTRSLEMKDVGNSASSFSDRQNSSGKRMNSEANAIRKSFESMLGTLSRTKESIGRATRIAIDGAKYGIAGEVLEILLLNLEAESSMHRRVDLFFLVDSITQCSRGQKGDIGEIYPSAVQAMLPRLLSAAAPPGNAARENRRQCLKVLRLWLERKTLPETIIRHHMRELESSDVLFTAGHSRRPLRMERAMNDPIREMEGMHVDEYGSNASFQLPGFCMPRMVEDEEGSDAEGSFEAVTPEQDNLVPVEREATPTSAVERHCHILEDVDGELEMEDVAPSYEIEKCSTNIVTAVDKTDTLHHQFQQHLPLQFPPPLPVDCPPSPPPLPASPPPVPPPPPPLLPQSVVSHSFTSCSDLKFHNPHNMQNPSQQHMSQLSDAPSLNSVMSNALHCYAPGYRELGKQSVRVGSYSSSSSSCKTCVPNPSVPTGGTQQRDRGTLHNKNYHLQPPPPTLSNQFSYVHADQRRQSWSEASSSYTRSFRFGQDIHTEDIYENRERIDSIPHERLAAPVRSVHVQSDNTEAAYASISQYGPPQESTRILDRGWSFPPRILNYHNPPPFRPSEAPNFWRPR